MFYARINRLFFAVIIGAVFMSSAAFANTASAQFFRMVDENDAHGVRRLLARGFDIDETYRFDETDRTPIFAAILRGRVEIVKCLLDAGANAELVSPFQYTPLMFSVMFATAPLNPKFSAEHRRSIFQIFEILLARGVDLEYANMWGWTALTKAESGDDYEATFAVTKKLLRAGARINPDFQGESNRMSPLAWAVLSALVSLEDTHENRIEFIEFLLGEGADPNCLVDSGKVHIAAAFDYEVTKALIDAGADKNARDAKGRRPFSEALARWNIPTMELLF